VSGKLQRLLCARRESAQDASSHACPVVESKMLTFFPQEGSS
jgi:hypothetical protein